MTFSIFKDLTGPQKFAILITSLLVIAVSTYVILFKLLTPDGAFNTQAAINFYHKGALILNYNQNIALQTLLPFQIVNGFFLTIFGNTFLATNLANIFFYLLLFGLFIFLTCTYRSTLPMLAFSCMSLSPVFICAFGGLGEVPALTFGLLGVSILVFRKGSYIACILAGILIAFAITTKWVLFLILPPVVLTLIMLRLDRKSLLYFLGAILLVYTLVSFLQFSHLESDEIGKLFRALISQNMPHYGSEYSSQEVDNLKTYGLRLRKIWEGYSSTSLVFFAQIKMGLSLIISFVAIQILFRRKDPLKRKDVFFIFLASFLLIYLTWAFTLNSRWPARRMLNIDVLIYLGTGLLPYAARFGKIGRSAVFGLLAIYISFHSLFYLYTKQENHLCNVITYESRMKEGLQLLPEDYNAYGQACLQAPLWSFLAGKNFKHLFRDSVFYDCIEDDCHNYLFRQPTISLLIPERNIGSRIFKLNNVFEFRDFQILRIEGFNNCGKEYVESVDFTEEKATQSIVRIHEKDRDKMYGSQIFEFNEMAVFLDNKRGLPLIEVVFDAHECHDGKNLRVALVNNKGKYIQNFFVTRGENRFEVSVPKKFRGSKIDVYLLLEKELRNKSPHCMAQNINRIPLEYKIVGLISKPSIFR